MKRENFDPYPGRIYENNGDGMFADWTDESDICGKLTDREN